MELVVQQREKFGKQVKSLRKAGLVPAELYGADAENLHLSVSEKEFVKVFKSAGENTIVNIVLDGNKTPVLITEVDYDPIVGNPRHIDFYRVRMDEEIKTEIPLVFIGEAPAVKDKGGILTRVMHEIEVEALPADLPHDFQVNLALLDDLEKSIHVRDLNAPSGVKILDGGDSVIATVKAFVEEAVVEEQKIEDVKVESEEKAEERKKEKETQETTEVKETSAKGGSASGGK